MGARSLEQSTMDTETELQDGDTTKDKEEDSNYSSSDDSQDSDLDYGRIQDLKNN